MHAVLMRAGDVLIAVALIMFALPLIGLVCLAIKLDSRGPVFAWQPRLGPDSRRFFAMKFRTTGYDPQRLSRSSWDWSAPETRVGGLLRYTRIDELPCIFNVLLGDIPLLGRLALGEVLKRDRVMVLGALASIVALAWAYLLLGGVETQPMGMPGSSAIPPEWTLGAAVVVFVMWAIMMTAMMLPSAAPVILLAAALDRQSGASPARSALFAIGYLLVWFAFSFAATTLQWALDDFGLLSEDMSFGSRLSAGAVLMVTGLYEWAPLKRACLTRCRSPLDLLARYPGKGVVGAITAGIRHGAFCVGCCWMLMALLFVGGLMSFPWIVGIALLVLVQKTLPWTGMMSRLAGVSLVLLGLAVVGMAA